LRSVALWSFFAAPELATRLDVRGRSRMDKEELVAAIALFLDRAFGGRCSSG
jgi:hypothetical protein